MKDLGILLTTVGVFILLLVILVYLGATYGGIVAWAAVAGALAGIGTALMIASKNED